MQQNTSTVLILAVAIVVIAMGAWLAWRLQRRRTLARKYGTEYERLAGKGNADRAVKELEERERRVSSFHLRELTPSHEDDRPRADDLREVFHLPAVPARA